MLKRKANVTLYLDKDLVKEAKSYGFNLSKLMENKIQEVLAKIDTPRRSTGNTSNLSQDETLQNELISAKSVDSWWARRELNSGSPPCEGGVLTTGLRALTLVSFIDGRA